MHEKNCCASVKVIYLLTSFVGGFHPADNIVSNLEQRSSCEKNNVFSKVFKRVKTCLRPKLLLSAVNESAFRRARCNERR